jgi:hypothetical protein
MATAKKPSLANRFAHLFNISAAVDNDNQDDDPSKQRADESDEDYAKRMDEEERKQRDGESDEDHAKRIKAMDEEEDDDKDGDDDKDESPKEKAARKAERARCAAIFADPSAAVRPDMAAHLAFNTGMSSSAAKQMMQVAAAGGKLQPRGVSLSQRMQGVRLPNPGSGAPAPSGGNAEASAAAIVATYNKVNGIRRS